MVEELVRGVKVWSTHLIVMMTTTVLSGTPCLVQARGTLGEHFTVSLATSRDDCSLSYLSTITPLRKKKSRKKKGSVASDPQRYQLTAGNFRCVLLFTVEGRSPPERLPSYHRFAGYILGNWQGHTVNRPHVVITHCCHCSHSHQVVTQPRSSPQRREHEDTNERAMHVLGPFPP